MPRKKLIRSALNPYHVYNRTNDREFYEEQALPDIWNYCCDLLWEESLINSAKIHAFVLMSNHFHLLISTPDENLDIIMRNFQSKLTKFVIEKSKTQKFKFCGPYKQEIIKSGTYYSNVFKYIYQNPMRANLVDRAEDYSFSTLNGVLGNGKLNIPLHPSELYEGSLPETLDEHVRWINESLNINAVVEIRKTWKIRREGGPSIWYGGPK